MTHSVIRLALHKTCQISVTDKNNVKSGHAVMIVVQAWSCCHDCDTGLSGQRAQLIPQAVQWLQAGDVCTTLTWPKLAAAMGCSWKERNSWDTGAPSSDSMMALALTGAKAGTRSCSLASSSVKAAGKRSDRVENSCPTLIKVGPNRSRDSLHKQKRLHQKHGIQWLCLVRLQCCLLVAI